MAIKYTRYLQYETRSAPALEFLSETESAPDIPYDFSLRSWDPTDSEPLYSTHEEVWAELQTSILTLVDSLRLEDMVVANTTPLCFTVGRFYQDTLDILPAGDSKLFASVYKLLKS